MIAGRDKLKELGLRRFSRYFDNLESQYLNLIYDPVSKNVVERWVYEKTAGLYEWKCAICGDKIFSDRNKSNVENFVCSKCSEKYNSKNTMVDRRIMDSRTKFFKYVEDKIYEELEDKLNRGKG